MGTFKDKVVWITGASSGIGAALVRQFAKAGSRVILSARRESALEAVKREAKLSDDQALVLPLDLANHGSMKEKVDFAMAHFGRIDILVNNGGISQRSLLVETDFSVFKQMIDVNYLGTVALTKAVLPVFMAQQSGHFGVVTSLMGKFASPLRSGYCGAKHALHGFFDGLRMEHQKDNVNVTIVCPGFIHTNISMNALTGDGSAQQSMDQATGAGMAPDVFARKMMRAMDRQKFEVYIGGKETFAIYLKRFFPRLLHWVVMRSNVT